MAVRVTNQPAPLRTVDVRGLPGVPGLASLAEELAGEPREWARLANEHPPVLRDGEVAFHPAWDSLLALGRRERLDRRGAHVERAAKFVALSQVEQGVGCPLSMTHAAQAVVDVPEGTLVGMSMTERQGGSDVRANETEARPAGDGLATLHGEKWFCSAPMSEAFLVLAQAPAGLSCYLVARGDGFVVERLKTKLGNRSNASAEIRLDGAPGVLVGEEGRGVAAIIEMVVHTRLDCVLGSAALMREATAQALHWCAGRSAFGRPLVEQPLMQNVLADLIVETEAATAAAVRLAHAFERDEPVRRLATAVLKYWVCKRTPLVVGEALECLGGNGYVSDSSDLPRLYRESPLNAIWEGSSNVQCLDVLRTLRREPEQVEAFLAELAADERPRVERALAEADEAGARRLVETMAVALQASLLEGDAAAAFRAREPFGALGTLPTGLPLAELVRAALPG
ncbi:MAG TPA: acyl-CoA dehydrogenase family protein [Gaiellaceae bacterium]|nr:acyl-CoA dehydrogenase family protein [Gaiellaceae bacterium]